jgi:transcriptional regulator with XRE-family HTH domain
MSVSPLQVRLARAALNWSVRRLASKAGVSPDSITRAEQDGSDITRKTLGAIQQALEEVGIEFLPEINSVSLHIDPAKAAICADPAMPLGVRRIYPRSAAEESGRYTVSIVRLPLPRHPLNEMAPKGHSLTRTSYRVETEAAALARARELIQAGYGIEVTGPNLRWDRTEVVRKLSETDS